VCHGKFHDILPKEHPGAFYDVPWGLYKGMSTNNYGQSDIVPLTQLISEIKNIITAVNGLFSTFFNLITFSKINSNH
jgi:hypothetical protein